MNKIASHLTRSAGQTLIYTLSVENAGTVLAENVFVEDLLPAEVSYQSDNSASSGTSYVPATGKWTIGTLAAGATILLDITVIVN